MNNTKDNIVKGSGDSGIKSLLIYVGTLYIVALFLAIAVVNRYIIDFGMVDEKDYLSLMGALVVNGMFIIIVPILLKKRGLLYLKKMSVKVFLFVIIIGVIAVLSIYICFVGVFDLTGLNDNSRDLMNGSNYVGMSLWLQLFSLAFFPAIAEELIFRGVIFSAARTKMNFWLSAIISSGLFAISHGFELFAVITFFFGGLWCYIYEKTHNITTTMLIHLLYNTIAVLCWNVFAASDVYQFDKVIKNNEETLILVTFVAMLILVSSILAIRRIVKA